ncbi:MAG: hypothetical protein OXP09_08300 [Gammaproteobacteria bacterium]|nr:hypothetical protein [Gammaproteobacteria bacterium]
MNDVRGIPGPSGTRIETGPAEAASAARSAAPPTDTGPVEAAGPPPPVEPPIPQARGAIDYGLAKTAAGTMADNVGVDFGHIAALMMLIDSELARAARDEQVAQIEAVAHEMHASAKDIRASATMALVGGVVSGGAQIGAAGMSLYGGVKGMKLTSSMPVVEPEANVPQTTTAARTSTAGASGEEPLPQRTESGESPAPLPENMNTPESGPQAPGEAQTRQVREETTRETVKEASTAKQKAAATRLDQTLSQQLSARAHSISLVTQGMSQLTIATGDIIKTAMDYESRMKDADSKEAEARAEEQRAYLDRTKGFADSMQKGAQDMLSIFQQMEDSMHQTHKQVWSRA